MGTRNLLEIGIGGYNEFYVGGGGSRISEAGDRRSGDRGLSPDLE